MADVSGLFPAHAFPGSYREGTYHQLHRKFRAQDAENVQGEHKGLGCRVFLCLFACVLFWGFLEESRKILLKIGVRCLLFQNTEQSTAHKYGIFS